MSEAGTQLAASPFSICQPGSCWGSLAARLRLRLFRRRLPVGSSAAVVGVLVERIVAAAEFGARVGGFGHPVIKLLTKIVLGIAIFGGVGDVMHRVRIFLQVVKLLGGALRASKTEQIGKTRIELPAQERFFGGAGVNVAEGADGFPHHRITRWPQVGPEIADQQIPVGSDGANGIAQVPLADVRVALALDENRGARLHLRLALSND